MKLASALLFATAFCAAQVPRPSTDYTIVMPDGSREQLSRYKGKIIVLEFLKVGCGGCQAAARVLQGIQKDYAARGVQVVGISIEHNVPPQELLAFRSQFAGDSFPVGNTTTPVHVYSYLQHSIMNPNFLVPQIVLIDRNFTIREHYPGGDERLANDKNAALRAALDKLLAGDSSAPAKARRSAS